MAANVAELIDLASTLVSEGGEDLATLKGGVWDVCVRAAMDRYLRERPREIAAILTGNGTQFLAMPEGWVVGHSIEAKLETPIDQVPEIVVPMDAWYVDATNLRVVTLDRTLSVGETARIYFSAPHTLTDFRGALTTSIPETDITALAKLVAAEGCGILSRKWAQSGDMSFNAGNVQGLSRSAEYARRKRELEDEYKLLVSPPTAEEAAPESETVNWSSWRRPTRRVGWGIA